MMENTHALYFQDLSKIFDTIIMTNYLRHLYNIESEEKILDNVQCKL